MAKPAKKKTSKAATRKPAAKAPEPHHEDHIDGCLCDVEVPEHLYTRDEDLPVTKGGVARR
ncbi:MAG: hypothetical protein V7604_460 [Hyphomicrobiales bacterium]|jgi:hypothetical protein